MNRTMKFGMVITLVVGTLAWLAIGGTNESASYYKTIAEIDKLGDGVKNKKLRVGGFVEAGSIKRSGNQVDFVLIEEDRKMKVSYNGNEPLPDTFKDGSQALIDGRMGDEDRRQVCLQVRSETRPELQGQRFHLREEVIVRVGRESRKEE